MDDFSSATVAPATGSTTLPAATPDRPRSVLILGSTGSIGTQALDVIAANRDSFRVAGPAAGGADPAAPAEQAVRFEDVAPAGSWGSPVRRVLDEADEWRAGPGSVADVLDAERWARDRAHTHLAAAGAASGSGRN